MNTHLTPDLVVSPNGFGFRADTGEVFQVNPTAREILAWMEAGDDETRIAQRLAERHDIPIPRVRNDLATFFESLENLQLLTTHE